MRTVIVKTENITLKERLLIDLTSLGYRVLTSFQDNADIFVVDRDELLKIVRLDEKQGIVIAVLDGVVNGALDTLLAADDVLIYPYSVHELELRLNLAQMKHGGFEAGAGENILSADGMTINFESYEVTIDGQPVDLTFKEYELLKCLISHRGRVYTRDQLLSLVWGYDYFGGTRTVDVHIRRLRAKLGRYESLVETVRNVGCRFKK